MDKYSLFARIYPMVIFLIPVIIFGISCSVELEKYGHIATTLGVSAALLYLLSNLGRDRGKKREAEMWKNWGGMPSAQLLYYKNNTIDAYTKRKYHDKLLQLSPITTNVDFEKAGFEEICEIYRHWSKYLITKTRDRKVYPLIFEERVNYGFRRNLWGLRPLGIVFSFAALLGNYAYYGCIAGFEKIEQYPTAFYASESILLILLMFWVFVVKEKWVKIPAFAFAERLLESIETIE